MFLKTYILNIQSKNDDTKKIQAKKVKSVCSVYRPQKLEQNPSLWDRYSC